MEAYALTEEMEDLRTEKNHTLASLGTADNKVMAIICRRTKQQEIIIQHPMSRNPDAKPS